VAEDHLHTKMWKKDEIHECKDEKLGNMLITAGIAEKAGVLAQPVKEVPAPPPPSKQPKSGKNK